MENLRLKYGNVELPIQDGYTITKSSKEVVYNDLVCGWDDTITTLPERYQEVQIINIDNNVVKAYGYVDSYDFGEMRETDIDKSISISLFSPMKIATLRTAIANGIYRLKDLIENYILLPLINDGFEIAKLEITDRQITVNFNIETIEYCMNNLAKKFNLIWFIDENKKIYVYDIDLIKNQTPLQIYDDNNMIQGLQYIKPTTTSDDYANVINFKNVRTYQQSRFTVDNQVIVEKSFPLISNRITSFKKDDEITFNYPVDTNPKNVIKSAHDRKSDYNITIFESPDSSARVNDINICFSISLTKNDDTQVSFAILVYDSGRVSIDDRISIDTENKDTPFILITDSFFSNLAVGLRYTGDDTFKEINLIQSECALVWNNNKFMYDKEIQKCKNKINKSGIVETTIDMNGSWKTIKDLTDIAQNYFSKNSFNYADKLELQTDRNIFKVGDCIKINKFGIDANYIITKITEKNINNESEYIIESQNSNNVENFVDTFRSEPEQESEDKQYDIFVTHYTDEAIVNTLEVVI